MSPFVCAGGEFRGLAYDWISGNVYVVTLGGFIFACDTVRKNGLVCAAVLWSQRHTEGIALHPQAGYHHYYISKTWTQPSESNF